MPPSAAEASCEPTPPRFGEALRFWLRLGFISFGGPAGQIAILHAELVERRRWISETRFLHALNYCVLLPGPEAQQLATYLGWVLHKTPGGLAAGILFVLPSALLLWGLSWAYVGFGALPWMVGFLYGLKPAVLAIVAASVWRIGSRALKSRVLWCVAGGAFAALFLLKVPFPWILASAGLAGLLGGRIRPSAFVPNAHAEQTPALTSLNGAPNHRRRTPPLWHSARLAATWLAVWWAPVLLAGVLLDPGHAVFAQGVFFSKAAMLTFGGAYAVLPYVAQQAVEQFHWLTAPQMLDGLGLAETTPGPLLIVLQFVGFLGGWNHPGNLPPLLAATLGAFLSTWSTFAPSFLWIFLGAPYIDTLRSHLWLNCVLSAITSAVVGLILNLSVWLGLQVLLHESGRPDWFSCSLCALSLWSLLRWKWSIPRLVMAAGLAGTAWHIAFA
jgi:chromate transporter